jgi:hypothetical protein
MKSSTMVLAIVTSVAAGCACAQSQLTRVGGGAGCVFVGRGSAMQ